ncbi:IclR family transcriptional regulator [uncultured Litoreibacter sp.]|uniref:IclR family transcriptional regulator n=1 Tax=uncultured Litoreibacter sp. TaxID=1392394 RepID=UPI00260805F3|nr:IclR family transcriptional regulator [uncultured Litoreibacter sp.]
MQSSIVQKVLVVLTVISEAQKPLTFSEIVTKCALNKSTVHRLLAICIEENMVRFDPQSKAYFLGPRVFDLVKNAYSGFDIQAIALDEMVSLLDRFGANVTLGIPSGLEVVYLRILEAPHSLGGVQRPGMREPVHCSASGKALLAFLPEKVALSKLSDHEFTQFTPRTITNAADFLSCLSRVRDQGFATNDREEYEHFLGISAPIFNYVGEAIAVLNIWSVYPQHSIKDLIGWSGELMQSADRVTDLIGGVKPSEPIH